ncbi:type I-F CRISPR-associated helicase Cas3f [Ideonella paludis]|uniref:Type I-F CRISPR-associated helicase Cas3 n=1 Tax=Ideonella paludis TaxID=1233411 RepID=A0ABS5E395_9BURK|nr:type I-F CRISPR-associated helicase Cas3f [Ideonella paludis]MBQ0937893.1 type I-F CRISPR-associated helicase Cas3 [Ideonella paludis]
MNVMLISQCDKRALTETRRILDQFAERRGDRTWQTPITQDGLDTLRKLLRKTARKNTAVACHWIRGLDHSELLWTVGDASRFNEQGAVPTNTTTRNVLREQHQNDWHHGDLIRLLADMAGLMHDLGKAIQAFQDRLNNKLKGRNLIRHEWVSLRLLEAFVGQDTDAEWLARLASPLAGNSDQWLNTLYHDKPNQSNPSPFKRLAHAPLASALGWLVVTHHRLPVLPFQSTFQASLVEAGLGQVIADWNEEEFKNATADTLKPYWTFPHGLPVSTPEWQHRAARIAKRLGAYAGTEAALGLMNNPYVLHLARLALMLADHHYSSLEVDADNKAVRGRVTIAEPSKLAANTRRDKHGKSHTNQSLDEHLVGVAQHSAEVARFLPLFERHLPRLAKHRKLKQRSESERFRWQDKAFELASSLRTQSQEHGAFIVNMASTGCGKTLANARIMYGLADPLLGMRCAFAMGLRTLTLQTGQAFRQLLNLDDDELAIRVGGAPNRMLFEHYEQEAEATGSASRQGLIEEDSHVLYEGQQDKHPLLKRAVADPEVRKLLLAPILVCTVDHLTPATESQRGGRQIAPMLRLMSGDLVLDEPDDFDLSDLPALTRLVHWAGLLGSRVLLSSATLPPALIQGLYEAYAAGRRQYQANRGARRQGGEATPPICCMWTDEFAQHHAHTAAPDDFAKHHQDFVHARAQALDKQAEAPRRRVALRPLEGLARDKVEACKAFAASALQSAFDLHSHNHSLDPRSGKRVSFGLVRMANVEPLIQVARAMFASEAPKGVRVHLCVYHSRHPLLIRSSIERQLDTTLKRHSPEAVFDLPGIRERLEGSVEDDHLFIVLGSPVTEVGRDHDYDWAVVEPSSLRSLIQLLGRVRRHRPGEHAHTNVQVFSRNLRSFTDPSRAAFCKPGFETDDGAFRLATHDLHDLLDIEALTTLDARPRIVCDGNQLLSPQSRLADLEHARMRDQMLPKVPPKSGRKGGSGPLEANASTWWRIQPQQALLTGLLQQQQPFRDDSNQREVSLVLLPNEDRDDYVLHQVEKLKGGRPDEKLYTSAEGLHRRLPDAALDNPSVSVWGAQDYMAELTALAESMDRPLDWCAERFGTVNVPASEAGWISHPSLGLWKRR